MKFMNEQQFLMGDREDIFTILRMRFGELPIDIIQAIGEIQDLSTLQRLILVACNAPHLDVFLEEMREGNQAYKITGERFNPLGLI
ncbi:hypothetical protein FHR92_002066 [Fontibacillus solani]|uniref:Uncharacterized protein n=1 Tax=Fontibacillus solani TaxID=1572857 RepID=A0A7W3ST28_9BACL|nr:hypothetical protein [Fontibacillus solani]MBA9085599.1 hypothetical protein [Fontibacillus solani]